MKIFKISFLITFFLILSVMSLSAKVPIHCEGTGCSELISKYSPFLLNFERNYLKVFAKNNMIATAMSNSGTIPYHINLDTMTFGFAGNVAYTSAQKITVYDPYYDNYKNIKEQGVAINPFVYFGMNLGWIYNSVYNRYLDFTDCDDEDDLKNRYMECSHKYKLPILSKIDLYVFGIKSGFKSDNFYKNPDVFNTKNYIYNKGFLLKFHLMEERRLFFNFIIFNGLSLGFGRSNIEQDLRLIIREKDISFDIIKQNFKWGGKTLLNYETQISSNYVDLRTGINIWFFRFYIGIGHSQHKGYSAFKIIRIGNYQYPKISLGIPLKISKINTNYFVNIENQVKENFKLTYFTGGVSVGGLTFYGSKTINNNMVSNKPIYSAGIGFSLTY